MDRFFESNPGFGSRIAHHLEFPDYNDDELLKVAEQMLDEQNYRLTDEARRAQPHFANARSIRNALARARLREANWLFEADAGPLDAKALSSIDAADIRASRVFGGGLDIDRGRKE